MSSDAPRRGKRALLGLLVCLAAPFAWVATLDSPFLRSSGAAMWVLLVLGLALTGSALAADRRKWLRAVIVLELALTGFLAWGQFGLARLPQPTNAAALERAPDFELPDSHGRPVRLSEELKKGPVLLVFFRGGW